MDPQQVEKPEKRSRLRQFLGKEFFVAKRKMDWLLSDTHFAKVDTATTFEHCLIAHSSLLLRPLKGVDMYLQYNKVKNLSLAIAQINKVVIKPGELFSFWRLVGRPTPSKGYLDGLTLHNGAIGKGTGGGLCQLGNLLYWMALHSPLSIKERWRHSYDVFPDVNRSIPFACGATLSYNYIDLQLQNNTDKAFQIELWLDDRYLHGKITCEHHLPTRYEIYETDHQFRQQWWGGYTRHNKIWKRTTQLHNGASTQELVAENNAIMMYSPLIGQ